MTILLPKMSNFGSPPAEPGVYLRDNYLFDTGRGESVVKNSLELKADLRTIKKIFLNRGHYNHAGGLPEVLKL